MRIWWIRTSQVVFAGDWKARERAAYQSRQERIACRFRQQRREGPHDAAGVSVLFLGLEIGFVRQRYQDILGRPPIKSAVTPSPKLRSVFEIPIQLEAVPVLTQGLPMGPQLWTDRPRAPGYPRESLVYNLAPDIVVNRDRSHCTRHGAYNSRA